MVDTITPSNQDIDPSLGPVIALDPRDVRSESDPGTRLLFDSHRGPGLIPCHRRCARADLLKDGVSCRCIDRWASMTPPRPTRV